MQNNIQQIQGIILIISSQIVVSARNPIHRIAAQVIVYIIASFIFMIQDYYFQGQTYIIVYVGAIAIQFLFVIMIVQIPQISSKTLITYQPKEIITTSQKNRNIETGKITQEKKINILGNERHNECKNIALLFKNNSNNIINPINNIMVIKNEIKTQIQNPYIFQQIMIIGIVMVNNIIINNNNEIYTYIYPTWAIEYKTMTDIETLGYIIYMGYPIIQIQIGIILWIVLIGIISICKS